MPKIESNVSTFFIAAAIAVGMLFSWLDAPRPLSSASYDLYFGTAAEAQAPVTPRPLWAASATGRVEPSSGVVRVSAQAGGRIDDVPVGIGDKVRAGDLLIRLDDAAAWQRVIAAKAEEEVRLLEREDEPVTGLALDRRNAEDEVETARQELFKAWWAYDETLELMRAGDARDSDVTAARDAVDKAKTRLRDGKAALKKLNANSEMPLPGRLDTSLTIARADLALAEEALEKTRIRAPFDGTVLNVLARVGETAAVGPQSALIVFGDVSKMRVRAEVEERDVAKVRIGQKAVIKADAFPNEEFEGVVTKIAGALGSPRIATRGPRRPNTVDVLEVVIDLDGIPPLLTGMRVDVFFRLKDAAAAKSASITVGAN